MFYRNYCIVVLHSMRNKVHINMAAWLCVAAMSESATRGSDAACNQFTLGSFVVAVDEHVADVLLQQSISYHLST